MADDPPIADESGFQTQENSYWQFSVVFYARQNIQELLLKAQNRHALDINMLLYALWQAAEGHSLSFGDFVKLNETIADWRKTILLPMRDLRRSLKSRDRNGDLYSQAQSLELSCEKVQQQIMYEQAQYSPRLDISGEGIERIALVNLDSYLEAMDLSLPTPVVKQLARELRNFVGL